MKKLLALVLALVMTLGLATVGANAADFKDESSIEYEEAVNVMSGIGVIQGDDNGNFNPKGTLTREQAAKIVAYMLMGKQGADSLSASSAPFSDVAADRWSAGAISYCATEGIIAGLGDGTFNPAGLLTGHQFAKMLLVALGYDAKLEGLEGDSQWAIKAAKLAVSAGLEDDLSIVMSQNITRDQAAMMAFNTLQADMVDYENGVNVKTSDGTDVTVNAKRYKVDEVRGAANIYDGRAEANEDVDKFCEVYFKDLKLVKTANNKFNEPVNQWSYKNKVISEDAKKADSVLVGAVTYQDLFNAAGTAAMNNVRNINIYVDGHRIAQSTSNTGRKSDSIVVNRQKNPNTYWTSDNDDDLEWNSFTGAAYGNSNLGLPTGNGTITSVFVDTVDTTNANNAAVTYYDVNINIKHVYVGEVTSVTEAKGSDARKVTINAKTNPSSTHTPITLDADYETTEFKKGDIVLFTAATDTNGTADAKIQSMKLATLVSAAEITKVSTEWDNNANTYKPNKSVVTAGGKDYKLNINVKAESKLNVNAVNEFVEHPGDKYDLYLDENGLIVYAVVAETEMNLSNYLVLVRGGMSAGTGSSPVADAVTLDGTKLSNITISKFDGSSINAWGATGTNKIDLFTVYKFTVNGGNYELKPTTSGTYTGTTGTVISSTNTTNDLYSTGAANLITATGNAATKLVVYDMADDGVNTYTGIKNFPNIKSSTNASQADALYKTTKETANGTGLYDVMAAAGYTDTYTLKTNVGAYVYLVKDGTAVGGVWVHRSGGNADVIDSDVSAEDVIYVTGKTYTTSKTGDDTIYTFDVIKDGKTTTVSTKSDTKRDIMAADQGLYLIKAYDGEYVEDVVACGTTDVTINSLASVDNNSATKWGRLDISTKITGNVYSMSMDVTSATFKIYNVNAAGVKTNYEAFATNSSTKFFEITKNGGVTEVSADQFDYSDLVKHEINVVYDSDDTVATYVYFQRV